MKKYIVDRFEGEYAVCEKEDLTLVNILRSKLPAETKEGDCLVEKDDGSFYIDIEATMDRKQQIRRKLDSLFE
ncbi:DUF3006 domain-containing protein [Herbinix luporum]|jgi:hypothetical protein|uniref:DUF3006 domain-containing protein n=1 Tax=Herbinix luporum TaxID=1679721 RepID=A0A0K8J7X2_9FIRM|nr:DUF3006 domain-containing protein [Herbinix luporum]MDI9489482.1 DUF3006 domain-containing protein [Bacillota bacterium]CUH93437.1 hypothetical protein SD1D_1897 [Herbinix luporum]